MLINIRPDTKKIESYEVIKIVNLIDSRSKNMIYVSFFEAADINYGFILDTNGKISLRYLNIIVEAIKEVLKIEDENIIII